MPQRSKSAELLKLSEEILSDIEMSAASMESIILKCQKLARIKNDFDALKWFSLELHGYHNNALPEGVTREEADKFSNLSGRSFSLEDPKEPRHYWPISIPVLESQIFGEMKRIENFKIPETVTPAIAKSGAYGYMPEMEYVRESFGDVFSLIRDEHDKSLLRLNENRALLGKIKRSVYGYVLNIYLPLKFENITASIFQDIKVSIDQELKVLCPSIIEQFLAVYESLSSNNPEAWSQAMSSCRNILKGFADAVFPAEKGDYLTEGKERLAVTEDKYKNRITAFIDKSTRGRRVKALIKARAEDLNNRLGALHDLLCCGTKNKIKKREAEICVLETYLLLSSLMELRNGAE